MKTKVEYMAWSDNSLCEVVEELAIKVQIGTNASSISVAEIGEGMPKDIYLYLVSGDNTSKRVRFMYSSYHNHYIPFGTNLLMVDYGGEDVRIIAEDVQTGATQEVATIAVPTEIKMYRTKSVYIWSSVYRKSESAMARLK